MNVNPQLALAHDFLEHTGTNIFLTGKAGTGKTTFLKRLREQSPKRMIVVAPTGVAAINAGGMTIHSFFQLPFGIYIPDSTRTQNGQPVDNRRFSKIKISIIKSIDLLVIDEISMVRADLLDNIDEVLRRYRDRNKPFGGVQLLMIGDMQQLAPVVRDEDWTLLREYYNSPYFFDSIALQRTPYTCIELKHIYRQSDREFIDLLAKVRNNEIDEQVILALNSRYIPDFNPPQSEGYITLTSHNNVARSINDAKLDQIKQPEYSYTATIDGIFPEYIYPVDFTLRLKEGAQVMFTKNDASPEKRYVNGTIGTIISIDDDSIEVLPTDAPQAIFVEPAEWENSRFTIDPQTKEISETIDGVFRQYPLKTAWAITIHKSQGLTFDRTIIDAADSFSHGQVYVALSRCRTLEGIVLRSPLTIRSIINDIKVKEFSHAIESNQPTEDELDRHKQQYYEELLRDMFDFTHISNQLRFLSRYIYDNLVLLYPKLIDRWSNATPAITTEIVDVGAKFCRQIHHLMSADYATDPTLNERVEKGTAYFIDRCDELITPLLKACKVDLDNKETKKVLTDSLGRVNETLAIKMATLAASKSGFSIKGYLKAKALATVEKTSGSKFRTESSTSAASSKNRSDADQKVERSPDISEDILVPELFGILREWRNAEAKERGVKPYMVATQKVIIGISNMLPSTKNELLDVKGVGKVFVDKYGIEVMSIIDDFRAGRSGEVE